MVEFRPDDFVLTPEQRAKALVLLKPFKLTDPKTGEIKTADLLASEGQINIFYLIVFRPVYRVHIMASTQYGKSLFVALACIVVACIQNEIVSILAPSDEKAKIIMRYFIEHMGDNPLFEETLEQYTKLERLRLEESKDRIILRTGGGIFVVSAQMSNSHKTLEAAMGLGSKIVIQDESCLISDQTEATIFRMIAGKGPYAFYCKIGNPFYRDAPYTHFYQSYLDPSYTHVNIDYIQGLSEGRYTRGFIEEARGKPLFTVLFENRFPDAGQMTEGGWSPLLTEDEVKAAFVTAEPGFGAKRLSADVAGGGRNFSTIVIRYANIAQLLYKSHEPDTMLFVGNVLRFIDAYGVEDSSVNVDAVGIGKGAADRMREQRTNIRTFIGNDPPNDPTRFINKRAEVYWKAREWILGGGKLEANNDWLQLSQMRWKVADSSGKIKLMSKEDLLKQGIESPDVADALAMTFDGIDASIAEQHQHAYSPPTASYDPYA